MTFYGLVNLIRVVFNVKTASPVARLISKQSSENCATRRRCDVVLSQQRHYGSVCEGALRNVDRWCSQRDNQSWFFGALGWHLFMASSVVRIVRWWLVPNRAHINVPCGALFCGLLCVLLWRHVKHCSTGWLM